MKNELKWQYGIVNIGTKKEPYYSVREIYHRNDKVVGKADASIGSETPEGLIKVLKMILKDVKTLKVFK